MQAVQDELPPGVLDMHLNEHNMHEILFLLAGPEDTPYAGGTYVSVACHRQPHTLACSVLPKVLHIE